MYRVIAADVVTFKWWSVVEDTKGIVRLLTTPGLAVADGANSPLNNTGSVPAVYVVSPVAPCQTVTMPAVVPPVEIVRSLITNFLPAVGVHNDTPVCVVVYSPALFNTVYPKS